MQLTLQLENEFGSTGEQLRDAGMQLAIDHAEIKEPKWAEKAYQYLLGYLKFNKNFMTEEFRDYALKTGFTMPPHARAWGGVVNRAARESIIIKVDIQAVKNPKAHCANAAVWERNDHKL